MRAWFAKFIRGQGFAILFCLTVLALAAYFSNRIGRMSEAFVGIDIGVGVFALLALMFIYMLVYVNSKKADKKTRSLFNGCGVVVSVFPSILLCFFVLDLWQVLFGTVSDRWYLAALALGLAFSVYGFIHARTLVVTPYDISLQAPEGTTPQTVRVVLLSDLHAGSYVDRNQLEKIVQKTNALVPDVVFISGDTFDHEAFGHCDMAGIQAALSGFTAKDGVYAVLGNHDPASDVDAVRAFFKETGIHLLVDAWAETDQFLIAGRDDIVNNPARRSLAALLHEATSSKPVIVLDHNPLGIEEAQQEGVSLTLCGHTHKGQFFPATIFTKWAYGARGFYGHDVCDGHHSVVTSGAGYFQLPVRLGTDSEVVCLDIHLQ